jgi:hypothetical protein
MFEGWLNKHNDAGWKADVDIAGRSGTQAWAYLEDDFNYEYGVPDGKTVFDVIEDGKYDFVVVQVNVHKLERSQTEGEAAIKKFAETTHRAGGIPILYSQGWHARNEVVEGQKLLYAMAKKHKARVAPCRRAWVELALHEGIDINSMKDNHGAHPGFEGHLANMNAFWAAFTLKSPEGMNVGSFGFECASSGACISGKPRSYKNVSDGMAMTYQKHAWQAYQDARAEILAAP